MPQKSQKDHRHAENYSSQQDHEVMQMIKVVGPHIHDEISTNLIKAFEPPQRHFKMV